MHFIIFENLGIILCEQRPGSKLSLFQYLLLTAVTAEIPLGSIDPSGRSA